MHVHLAFKVLNNQPAVSVLSIKIVLDLNTLVHPFCILAGIRSLYVYGSEKLTRRCYRSEDEKQSILHCENFQGFSS